MTGVEKILQPTILFGALIFLDFVFIVDSSLSCQHGNLTTPELLMKDGYPSESHVVQTEDGYILEIHRIPYGKKCRPALLRPKVVLLEHGILGNSSTWLTCGTKGSLGYVLADHCYDVWLGNFRGNTYGKKHTTLSPDSAANKKFWDFSFHEMGRYDIPATIDYILGKTGVSSIYYVGYSMGSTAGLIAMMERPEYNKKIRLMSLMAPVVYMGNLKGSLRPVSPKPVSGPLLDGIRSRLSDPRSLTRKANSVSTSARSGLVQPYFAKLWRTRFLKSVLFAQLPWIENIPAGTSVKVGNHFLQNIKTGKFDQFDYGPVKNLQRYGKPKPPKYDWSKITVPVALYMGKNDYIVQSEDTAKLKSKLKNLKRYFVIKDSKFSHLDFLYAKDIKKLVHNPLISFMKKF